MQLEYVGSLLHILIEKKGEDMRTVLCMVVGYLLGSLSPAALLSKIKKKDLREHGSGNLGTMNTMMNFGKRYALPVMIIDILKGFLAVKLAHWIVPTVSVAGVLAGGSAVLGHVFPFYMKFKGGKGLAPFGGMILALSPLGFLSILLLGGAMMIIINYSFAMPFTAGLLFPIIEGIREQSMIVFLIAVAISTLIIAKHWSNMRKAMRKEDAKIRDYFKKYMMKKKDVE